MTAHHDVPHSSRNGFGPRALDHLKAQAKAFAATLVRRRAVGDLARMDDRMLADVGLTRAEVESVNRWSLWGDPTVRLAEAAAERHAKQS
ncbi:MAG: DUF1127 domain-containing protein [Hansschlegelia sp.]